jgi:putative tricarboxylic transport membrane protein
MRLKWTIARSTGAGCVIGIIPGAGALVGAIVAYGIERAVAKDKSNFGKGEVIGLAATETANNATTGAATIPLLTLGIPGSAATAIVMAALMIHGIQPGALLFVSNPELVYTVFVGFMAANILMVVFGMLVARWFTMLMKVPPAMLCSGIVVLCVVGTFGVRNNIADVYICIIFGILGYFLRRFGVPTVPLILGVTLGPLSESYLLTAMITYNNDVSVFFTRPYTLAILLLTTMIVAWSLWPRIRKRTRGMRQENDETPV